jgi:hypothetical protein
MKSDKLYGIIMAVVLLMTVSGCETTIKDYSNIPDNTAPGIVTNVSSKPISGGVTFHYTLPGDDDLMGVKAVYTNDRGENLLMFASGYVDSLTITGIGNTDEREVKLIVMDNSNNESAPVTVKIIPGQTEIEGIAQTLVLQPYFGGISATWTNPNKIYTALEISYKNASGDFVAYDSFYSDAPAGEYNKLGDLASVPTEFRVYMRDHWGNKSEIRYITITPNPYASNPYLGRKAYFSVSQLTNSKYASLSAFTYEIWIKGRAFTSNTGYIMGVWTDTKGTQSIMVGTTRNQVSIWGFISTDIKSVTLDRNKWYHIALSYNGSSYAVYIDGVLRGSGEKTGNMNLSKGFDIGGNDKASGNLDGEVRDARVWNVARTQEEINENMCGVDPNTPGLIANWKFDDGKGTMAKDSSPNHYHIYASGAIEWRVNPFCGFE